MYGKGCEYGKVLISQSEQVNCGRVLDVFKSLLDMVWMLQPYHIHRLDYIHFSIYFMICLHYYSLTMLTPLCLKKLLAIVGILQPYNIHILYYTHSSIYLMCWIHYYNLTILTPWCLNKLACQKCDITTLPNSQPLLYSLINIPGVP